MPYGTIKVDTITFTAGGVDTNVSISGLVQNPTFSGNITTTGNITGANVIGTTTVSGATVTGTTGNFAGTITAATVVGTTTVSGATVTGNTGSFTTLTGGVTTITSGVFATGTAALPSISFTSDPNTGIYSPGADQVAISTNSTGRLFVDASGNVGVGVAPAGKFHVGTGGTYENLLFTAPAANQSKLFLSATSSGPYLFQNATTSEFNIATDFPSGFITFGTGASGTEKLRITSDGKLGLGTSAPQEILEVAKTSAGSSVVGALFSNFSASANTAIGVSFSPNLGGTARAASIYGVNETSSQNATALTFHTKANGLSQTEKLRITSAGFVGIGTSSPSYLLDASGSASTGIRYKGSGSYGGIATDNSSATGGGFFACYQNGTQKSIFGVVGAIAASTSSDTGLFAETGQGIQFFTNGAPSTPKAVITSAGNVGIGTTTPATTLEVNGTSYVTDLLIRNNAGTPSLGTSPWLYSPASGALAIATNASERVRIDSSGRLLVGTSSVLANSYGGTAGLFQVAKNDYLPIGFFTYSNSPGEGGFCPYVELHRARGTQASPIAVGNTDDLGIIHFYGHDGSTFIRAAHIKAVVDGTPGTSDMPGRLVFSTTPDGASSPQERMRIRSDGCVGIANSGNVNVRLFVNAPVSDSNNWSIVGNNASGINAFGARGDGAIYLGLLSNSPYNSTTIAAANAFLSSDGYLYRSTSSLKYKKNVRDAEHGLQDLLKLRPVTYQSKSDIDGENLCGGLIAEEVDAIGLSEFVQYATDGTPDALAYGNMITLCIKAIQEQQVMITELQSKVTALEAS